MLRVNANWDWCNEEPTPEEQEAIEADRLCAVIREDGDNNAAIVAAVTAIKAPPAFVALTTIDPMIADCFVAIAWDTRFVEVINEDE